MSDFKRFQDWKIDEEATTMFEILDTFKNGFGVEFNGGTSIKDGLKRTKIISTDRGLADYLRNCPVDPVKELSLPHLVHNWREFHLYFDDFGDDEGVGECFYTYAETYWAIFKEKDHIIRTGQLSLCTPALWDLNFRIFIHPQEGFGEVFEIFVGCETQDGYKIGIESPIGKMLETGAFGQLFQGHEYGCGIGNE